MSQVIHIDDRVIGPGSGAFIIAEVGQAHDGSLNIAHSFIDAAAEVGADAIKFQTHIAAEESTLDEPFRIHFSRQDGTRFEYWRRMEFTSEQWSGLASHAADRGLVFLSSAFSTTAVDLLSRIGIAAWKVGSGEFQSAELLDAMVKTGKPILYSTGMSTWREIDAVVDILSGYPVGLFQCTSRYPTNSESVGLNLLNAFRERYGCPVGLSDHSGKIFAPLSAMAREADMIEVHVTFDRRMFGVDASSSLTFDELGLLVTARDEFRIMNANPVDKDEMAAELGEMRDLFSKSIAPARRLESGEVLTEAMLVPKKPGTGIPYNQRHELVGMRLRRSIDQHHLIRWDDIEDSPA